MSRTQNQEMGKSDGDEDDFQYNESFESDGDTVTEEDNSTLSSDTQRYHTTWTDSESSSEEILSMFIQRSIGIAKQRAMLEPYAKRKRNKETRNHELAAFCAKCISNLRCQNAEMSKIDKKRNSKDKKDRVLEESASLASPWKYQMERMKAENLNRYLEKIAKEASISEEPSENQSSVKSREFIRRKIKIIEHKKVEEKYIKHITDKTSALLIADIIQSAVNPLASPDEVWMELLKPLHLAGKEETGKNKTKH